MQCFCELDRYIHIKYRNILMKIPFLFRLSMLLTLATGFTPVFANCIPLYEWTLFGLNDAQRPVWKVGRGYMLSSLCGIVAGPVGIAVGVGASLALDNNFRVLTADRLAMAELLKEVEVGYGPHLVLLYSAISSHLSQVDAEGKTAQSAESRVQELIVLLKNANRKKVFCTSLSSLWSWSQVLEGLKDGSLHKILQEKHID